MNPIANAARGPALSGRTQRFVFIDALRGLAALAVVACHFVPNSPLMPELLAGVMRSGALGVQVFFVISGFVIAYSVRGAAINARYLGNFALRRSLRLDPPYWATMLCIWMLGVWAQRLAPSTDYVAPSWPQVLAHLVYLQTFLGYKDLCIVFWTLRLEVMFYLLFMVLLGCSQRLGWRQCANSSSNSSSLTAPRWQLPLVFLPLALASLAAFTLSRGPGVLQYFHMFLLGAYVWWALGGVISSRWIWLFATLMAASLLVRWNVATLVALATGLAVYLVGRAGHLGDWLNQPLLQYLGRISYSLYLIHKPVCLFFQKVGLHYWDSPAAPIVWNVVGLLLSFVAAQAMYRFVEQPSLSWVKRFSLTLRRPALAGT